MKFDIYTVGCKVNHYESEAMEELFVKRGFSRGSAGEKCDVYVVNTCTVTNLSDRKSRQFMSRAKRLNPNAILAVVGCYSQISPEEVAGMDGVDVIIGTKNRGKIVDLCMKALEAKDHEKINIVEEFGGVVDFDSLSIDAQQDRTRAYIKIQEGCNMFCSYCIIPYARGPIKSRLMEDIYMEASRLAAKGYKEIVLTGIHVSSYGKDLEGHLSLIDVIEKVSSVDGIQRIRLSSLEPNGVTDDFLSRAKATGKLCDHFHLSLQSGSNKILSKMNRKYTTEIYRDKVDLIRQYFPEAGLTTDIIVGFPGEIEEDFNDSCRFVEEIKFSKVHVFQFSGREGTPAYGFDDQVAAQIKKERSSELIELSDQISRRFKETFINQQLSVLFENKEAGESFGYSTNYLRIKTQCDVESNEIRNILIQGREGDLLFGIIK